MGNLLATSDVDFSTGIDGIRTTLVEAINANSGALLQIMGLMVAVSLVFWLIKRVTHGNS
jgi:hypothetical protein